MHNCVRLTCKNQAATKLLLGDRDRDHPPMIVCCSFHFILFSNDIHFLSSFPPGPRRSEGFEEDDMGELSSLTSLVESRGILRGISRRSVLLARSVPRIYC